MKHTFIIKDWADNDISLPGQPSEFISFDEAEEALSEYLGADYEETRQEYFICDEGGQDE